MRLEAERFQEADKYAAYLRTPEGRLRADLAWRNLLSFLPAKASGLRALDAGGGTGTFAIRMAEMGFDVTLLDISEPMLALARKEAGRIALKGNISFEQGDAARLPNLFQPASFHILICHNLLEYMDNPSAVLSGLATLLKEERESIVSLLVRNRWGEVLKAAIKGQDVERATTALHEDTVPESLYGQPVRLFDPDDFRTMVERAGLEPLAVRGVRVVSDYLDCETLTPSAYQRLLDFEMQLGAQPQLAGVARYTQVIARRSSAYRQGTS